MLKIYKDEYENAEESPLKLKKKVTLKEKVKSFFKKQNKVKQNKDEIKKFKNEFIHSPGIKKKKFQVSQDFSIKKNIKLAKFHTSQTVRSKSENKKMEEKLIEDEIFKKRE